MQILPVQYNAVVSERINVWRWDFRTSMKANVVEAEIIGHYYHNIWLLLIIGAAKVAQCKTQNKFYDFRHSHFANAHDLHSLSH